MCVDLLTLHTRIMATNWSKEKLPTTRWERQRMWHTRWKKRGDLRRICKWTLIEHVSTALCTKRRGKKTRRQFVCEFFGGIARPPPRMNERNRVMRSGSGWSPLSFASVYSPLSCLPWAIVRLYTTASYTYSHTKKGSFLDNSLQSHDMRSQVNEPSKLLSSTLTKTALLDQLSTQFSISDDFEKEKKK